MTDLEQLTLLPDESIPTGEVVPKPTSGKEPIAAADLQTLPKLDVWELRHHPRNVRRHNLPAIVESLRTYGQQTPIVVQKSTGYVCKGNGTLKAARDVLGWSHIFGTVEDFDDDTALRYLLADNRTSDTSENDKAALGALLKELDAGAGGLQGTLFDLDAAETIWDEMGQLTTVVTEFNGDYAETPEELAARIEAKSKNSGGVALKEVVLALKPEEYEAFALTISKLSRAYGTRGVIATVLEAIRRAGEQVVA
jgi:hypothetical protein